MNKNLIKKLADASYSKNEIDSKKVNRISKSLKRAELKVYINSLKIIKAKKTVSVSIPSEEGISEMRKYFSEIYPGKKISFNLDQTLISGIKVEDYDNVYELSIKGFLEKAVKNTND